MKTANISLSGKEKITLISNLSTLLSAGIPILEAVDSLLEDAKGNQKKILETLRADLVQGKQISYSLAKFPLSFNKVTVNIIKASEESGTLDVILTDLRATIKKEMEFEDKIKSAMVYPVFILVVFTGVLLMILIVVIPKIASVFTQLRTTLPLPTRILIFMSNLILYNSFSVIIGIVIFAISMLLIYRREKRLILNFILFFPVLSTLASKIDLARFSRSLYLLLNAGIPITTALMLSEEVIVKRSISNAVSHAKNEVISGKKLSKGLKDAHNIFPSIMIKIVEAGEKSGTLDKSMKDVGEFFDYEVNNSLKVLTSLLEPLMLVLVGVLVGGIMLAIIAPIYGLIGSVHAR